MAMVPCPVVIDTDPGIDDALALMLALRSPELQVALMTTVAGNVPIDLATANARRLLALINPPTWPQLAQGAGRPLRRALYTATAFHSEDGLGGLSTLRHSDGHLAYPVPEPLRVGRQAVQHILQAVQRYGSDLTLIALGPLTNIARAIQRDAHTMRQLGRLIIMGGAIAVPGNVTPSAEFNIFVDPHAADIVFRTPLAITLVPLDVTQQVRLTETFVRQTMQTHDTPLTRAMWHLTRQALQGPYGPRGMALHDPLAVAVAIDATLVQCVPLPLVVERRSPHTLGMTVADRRDAARRSTAWPEIQVALEVDAARVLALFAERVLTKPVAVATPLSTPQN
jgi:purine nucleosidase/pyrimidine-specific ribonucleoside hydrolase